MGFFTREEKYNKETGKFEVTKKGLIDYFERKPKKVSLSKQLERQYYRDHPKESPKYKRQQTRDKLVKGGGKTMDFLFGSAPKKKKGGTRRKQQYVVKGNVAYPVARPSSSKKPGKKLVPDYDFDFDYDMMGFGSQPRRRKKKSDSIDLFDNWGFF